MAQRSCAVRGALLLAIVGLVAVGTFLGIQHLLAPPQMPIDTPAAAGFRECAAESGINFRMAFLPAEQGEKFKINLYDHGCGVAVADFDGDGHDDVYFVNQLGSNALYRNKGDGTFEDVTTKAGVGLGDRICVGAAFGDYDNDGYPDLYVTSTRGGNVLFRNMGDGTFKNVTAEVGLLPKEPAHSQTAVFFDFDNDGYLDLLVTNTAKWTLNNHAGTERYYPGPADFWAMVSNPIEHNVLYRNVPVDPAHPARGRKFVDVTAKSGLAGKGWSGDVAVFDFDEDGRLDVLITNMFGASQLYRNNGDGTFADVTATVLGRTSWGAIGAKAFDYNNDGRLDLLIVDMHSDMWLPAAIEPRKTHDNLKKKYTKVMGPMYDRDDPSAELEERFVNTLKFRYQDVVFGNTFFKKLPSGKFVEVSEQANLETFWPWGIATGDFDNDGFEDVFLPSGMGYPFGYWPNALMMNNGNETFTDRASALGIEPPPGGEFLEESIGGKRAPRSSRCAATADFAGDGRLSLVVNNFNDQPYYFRNQLPRKNYIAFRLTGTRSNRDSIGALVQINVGNETMVRQVHAAGGYLSQSSRTVHFGLGERTAVDRVTIQWPSGEQLTLTNPAINCRHKLTEPDDRVK